jgi:hypothetical protein
MEDNDDKPTVVLDFNALKSQLKKEEELGSDLEFNVNESSDELVFDESLLEEEEEQDTSNQLALKRPVIFFQYKDKYFTDKIAPFLSDDKVHLIEDLNSLNALITKDGNCSVVFYYNANPKVVNQLVVQLKKKFKQTKCIIVAKNLSKQKADQHKKTAYGAHGYLSDPFNMMDLFELSRTI